MADDLTKKRPHDARLINTKQPYEVDYWCKQFDISKNMLCNIVKKVGPRVDDVKLFLRKYR